MGWVGYLRGEAADYGVLGLELVLPVGEDTELLVREAVEVAADVVLALAHLAEGTAGLAAGKDRVGAAGTVEALAGGYIVDGAADGDVDRLARVRAIETPQLLRR